MANLKDLKTYAELSNLVDDKKSKASEAKRHIEMFKAQIAWANDMIDEEMLVIEEYEDLKKALGTMLSIMTGRE